MYYLRRLLYMIFVVIGVSMLMFALVRVLPAGTRAKAVFNQTALLFLGMSGVLLWVLAG